MPRQQSLKRDAHTRRPWQRLAVLMLLAFAVPTLTSACSVPVFRYALEHWQPDPYVAIVFHRGELSDDELALVEKLNPQDDAGIPIANIIVRTVDLDDNPSEVILDLWKQHQTETLPLLSLQTPPKRGAPKTAWQGELTDENVSAVINSPTRQQLRKRLLGGDSVVWLFLESGDQEADDQSYDLLQKELARLQEVIELPTIEEQDLHELSVAPETLKIGFSAMRVSRDDPFERPLVEMLLRVEPDLLDETYVHQAMAFPVFGRGRALYALVGDGITSETIEEANRFLGGACQCTVKAQNPGVDLLMAVDWDQHVVPALPFDESQPSLAGLTSFARPPLAVDPSEDVDPSGDAVAELNEEPEVSESAADLPKADAPTVKEEPTLAEAVSIAATPAQNVAASAANVESLTHNITLLLAAIVAFVVLATLLIIFKSR